MSKESRNIDLKDDAAQADHDDDTEITAKDLGNDGASEEGDEDEGRKPTKKSTKTEEEEEEDEGEEEEEDEGKKPDADPEKLKLAKKLARAGRAREQLEKQLSDLRKQVEQQTQERSDTAKARFEKLSKELDDLYEQVEDFRAEGKAREAAKAQRRIDEIRDGMTRSQAALYASKEALQQTELRAYNTMVQELESLDPRFDEDHEDYDQGAVDSVNELVEAYEAKGMALPDALRKACKVILREDVFASGRSLKRDAPRKQPEKKKTDVDKNLKAAKKQPPDEPGSKKERPDKLPNMETITEAEYDALPESVKRRLEADADA